MSEPRVIWFCPACEREVFEGSPYEAAEEGQDVTGFPESGATEIAWGKPVRFHLGHFRTQLGGRYYRRIFDRAEPTANPTPFAGG
jgi:hypothetical protein